MNFPMIINQETLGIDKMNYNNFHFNNIINEMNQQFYNSLDINNQQTTESNINHIQQEKQEYNQENIIKDEQKNNKVSKRIYKKKFNNSIKRWSQKENSLYQQFILQNYEIFEDKSQKRKKNIFIRMSDYIKTKNSNQCRSHHQKFYFKYFGQLAQLQKNDNSCNYNQANQYNEINIQNHFNKEMDFLRNFVHFIPNINQNQNKLNNPEISIKKPFQFKNNTDQIQYDIQKNQNYNINFQQYLMQRNSENENIINPFLFNIQNQNSLMNNDIRNDQQINQEFINQQTNPLGIDLIKQYNFCQQQSQYNYLKNDFLQQKIDFIDQFNQIYQDIQFSQQQMIDMQRKQNEQK